MRYRSQECEAVAGIGTISVTRGSGRIDLNLPSRRDGAPWMPGAPMIMLELTEDQRRALDLPACEAITGGTALCLLRDDVDADLPRAPTCWAELVAAEIAPLAFMRNVLVAGPECDA